MKKNYKKVTKLTNAIESASTTAKNWGFAPVPGKGGTTTNAEIPDWMFLRELEDLKGEGV